MTLPETDRERLAELHRQWHRHPERRAEIEDQAAEVTAVHLLTTMLDAVVPDGADTQDPPTGRSTTP